ncbi:MAG: hypothetical protein U9R56_03485 [candidate division Zixibacteria bacterium]|nr:hypothetical protein [candidate division Zixibacteria bacterium]
MLSFRSNRLLLTIAGLILFISIVPVIQASVPQLISYQGRLTNIAGIPLPDSSYSMEFSIYVDSVDGVPLWTENVTVTTVDGLFSHMLGSIETLPSSLFEDHSALYLGVSRDGVPLDARTRLVSAPYAQAAGNLEVRDAVDTLAIKTCSDDHRLSLYDSLGQEGIRLQGTITGDESVILPDSSVNALEILNESGFTMDLNVHPVTLVDMEMVDLVVVEIETPADGYILLEGKCYVVLSGTTGPNYALVQIDETVGGGTQFPYYSQAGLGAYVNTNDCYFPIYVTRAYYKPAGVYEFRMEGRPSYPAPARAKTWDHVLTATYLPTGYGVVSKVATEQGNNPTATPLDIVDPQNPDGGRTLYQMDLRYHERQSKEARKKEMQKRE